MPGYHLSMRAFVLVALAACSPTDDVEFAFLGTVVGVNQGGSTIALWEVHTPEPYSFKFGDGQATPAQFDLGFRLEPPDDALEGDFGVGIAVMLPGLSTAPEGPLDPAQLNAIGRSSNAVIFKRPGATGPAWLDEFADGFSCGFCVRDTAPATFAPVDCTFVEIRPFNDPCNW
jgi:hypothetical protein